MMFDGIFERLGYRPGPARAGDALLAIQRGDTDRARTILRELDSGRLAEVDAAAQSLSTLAWQVRKGRSVPRSPTQKSERASELFGGHTHLPGPDGIVR